MLADFRIAARSLAKSPGFTGAAVAALALGIGANTTIFSGINSMLLNPGGVDRPERVVGIRAKYDKLNLKSISLSLTDYDDIRKAKHLFAAAAVAGGNEFSYLAGGVPERLFGARVSPQWFDVFGARPLHGRLFRDEEDQPKANYVVVLSYGTWQRLFGGRLDALGQKIDLNRESYEIIGVMPPEFRVPAIANFWYPAGFAAEEYGPRNRFNESWNVMARLQPGVTFDQANAAVKTLAWRNLTPDQRTYAESSQWGMFAITWTEQVVGEARLAMLVLIGAVAFVLLIACSNIAGLLLARASGKAREIAVRSALGAGRFRIIREALAESLLLAAGGAVAGLALAYAGLRALVAIAPPELYADRI
ncbi:MAG: ABC transporter permease, partial [Bryobacteraceae bacterium]